ncbi:hypothetical protein AAT19DRAFT_10405 [Rhodotorula toruloides]|uniref:Uncharacterized protein n=1 Tax=Rhodotorula toruloides TaxID=5286 RepID=A0A2T0A0L1_RHOTO|nr:hypothetical protein AAT19DRAFT_10405 [Rhodotorula toruloides]
MLRRFSASGTGPAMATKFARRLLRRECMGASGRQKSWQGPQETDCGTLPLDLRSLRASYGGQGVRKDLRGLERRTVLGRKALGYRFGRTCVTCVCVSRLRWPLTLVSTVPPALGDPLRCEYARVEWRFGASDRDQRTSIGRIEGHNQEDPPAVTTHRLTLHGDFASLPCCLA